MRLDQMIRAHPISVHLQLADIGGGSDAEQAARDAQLKALLSQRVMVSMHQHKCRLQLLQPFRGDTDKASNFSAIHYP